MIFIKNSKIYYKKNSMNNAKKCFVDINNFSPAPILFKNKPKSIGWSDDVDVTQIELMFYVRGNYGNNPPPPAVPDNDCGPSYSHYVIKSYSDITTSVTSGIPPTGDPSWIWNNAFITIGWSPNKDYFPIP